MYSIRSNCMVASRTQTSSPIYLSKSRNVSVESYLMSAEHEKGTKTHDTVMRRDLGLMDLVLMQFLCVVSTTWLGAAGKLGSSHAAFWIIAMLLFYVPLAVVVIHLNWLMPIEGGLYQWTKETFGKSLAFMVGWNLWLFSVLNTALIGLQVATYLSYALGPHAAWMTKSPWFSATASASVVTVLSALTILGFRASKWIHNASGIALTLACIALLGLPLVHYVRGSLHTYAVVPSAVPSLSLFNLSILGKMGFGAFCGFEYVAIVAGECRDPRRIITRSVLIASVGVAIVYILGTATVLAFVPLKELDLVSPISQVLSVGLRPLGVAGQVAPVAILVLLGCSLGGGSINFTTATRLPMVAGWDRELPAWFGRLHPRLKTPVNAILATAVVTLAAGMSSLIGIHHEESFQTLLSGSLLFYALTYLVMFAIPLCRAWSGPALHKLWLKIAAVSGFMMTLLYIITAIVPIVEVESAGGFSGRVLGVAVCGNFVGAVLLMLARRARAENVESGADK